MKKHQKLQFIRDSGIIAIMRADSSASLMSAATALLDGGVRVIEVTMTTPGALEIIADSAGRFGEDVLFGAGSALDAALAQAKANAENGA